MRQPYRLMTLFCWLAFCGAITLSLSACAKKQMVKKDAEELEDDEFESEELDIHGKNFVVSRHLDTIRFAYDSSKLSSEARDLLAANAKYLMKKSNLEILTEGHCDERGTIGYNLALGQKRGAIVRKYYLALGIEPERVGSLSYGEEKLLCFEHSEDCWSKNRRVETKIRAFQTVSRDDEESEVIEDEIETKEKRR